MKQTQRAKDYAVIGELARRLPPAQELLVTTDPDRLLTLAPQAAPEVRRPAVRAAIDGDRDGVVVALAREQDSQRRSDAARMEAYAAAAGRYLEAFSRLTSAERRLPHAHARVTGLAEHHLPITITLPGGADADAG